MDISTFIPEFLMRDSIEGKITGSQGEFTRNGDGYGKYKFKQMEWNDKAGTGGFGYEMSFSFSDQKPRLMPNSGHHVEQMVMPDAGAERPLRLTHKPKRRHRKVRK